MQEILLYERWRNLAHSSEIIHCGSDMLQVFESGQLSLASGPDFRSARFSLNGIVYQGDVECHSCQRDWYRHQHHLDRKYANVLLHVIPEEVSQQEQVLHQQSMRIIPTVGIPKNTKTVLPLSCPRKNISASILTELGIQRFRLKMFHLATLTSIHSPEQVFYELLLRALGYHANSAPFEILAQRLTWSWLQAQLQQGVHSADLLAIYSGIAGFLPTTSEDPFLNNLVQHFEQHKNTLDAAPMHEDSWQFAGIRPFNHPHFRMAAWIELLQRYPNPMLVLKELLEQRLTEQKVCQQINHFFNIPCSGYWKSHYGLNLLRKGPAARVFLGPARINEILLNVTLPFFAVCAQNSGSSGFLTYLIDLYCQLPMANTYGIIKQQFPLLFHDRKRLASLAIYQGLLYLKQYYCESGKCNVCPSKSKNSNFVDNL